MRCPKFEISRIYRRVLVIFALVSALSGTSGCGGESLTQEYTVGGLVTGLAGGIGLTLILNDSEELTIYGNGPFIFKTDIWKGSTYDVKVLAQPTNPDQTCIVTNGTGTSTKDVSNVEVVCDFLFYTVSGSLSGMVGSITLLNDNSNKQKEDEYLTLTADGGFTFVNLISHGEGYQVTVSTLPDGQSCTVSNGSGVAVDNVTDVTVVCSSGGVSIGGTVTGLQGTLYLQNNYDIRSISQGELHQTGGVFAFNETVASGGTYNVRVYRQPTEQICSVTNGSGVANATVSNVQVFCRQRFNLR